MVVSPTWFQFGGDIEAVAEKLNSGISSNFVWWKWSDKLYFKIDGIMIEF